MNKNSFLMVIVLLVCGIFYLRSRDPEAFARLVADGHDLLAPPAPAQTITATTSVPSPTAVASPGPTTPPVVAPLAPPPSLENTEVLPPPTPISPPAQHHSPTIAEKFAAPALRAAAAESRAIGGASGDPNSPSVTTQPAPGAAAAPAVSTNAPAGTNASSAVTAPSDSPVTTAPGGF